MYSRKAKKRRWVEGRSNNTFNRVACGICSSLQAQLFSLLSDASALNNYREATARDRNNASGFLRQGILYGRLNQQVASDEAFNMADYISLFQGYVEGRANVRFQRGVVYLANKHVSAALNELEGARDFARVSGAEALALVRQPGPAISLSMSSRSRPSVFFAEACTLSLDLDPGIDLTLVKGRAELCFVQIVPHRWPRIRSSAGRAVCSWTPS